MRLEKEKPVLEAFWSWMDQQKPVRNTRMDKAVNYVPNRRETAQTYLEDGAAVLQIISARMRSVRLPSAGRTGCSVILLTEPTPVL